MNRQKTPLNDVGLVMQISTAKVRREGPRKNPSFESERASLRLWQAQDVMKRLSFLDHGTSRNRPREMKHGGGAVLQPV